MPNDIASHCLPRAGRKFSHAALLAGVSVLSLMLTATQAQARGDLSVGSGFVPPVTAASSSSIANAAQAAAVTAAAQSSLSRATQALTAMQDLQTAARSLMLDAPSSVPDGLSTGGLEPDSGLASSGVANPVKDWIGAQTPTQTTSGGQTTVTVQQTAAQAILSWNSFNIGRNTTLDFNQQGNTTWTALNRVSNSVAPSQILGNIQATGQVYVINNNGIIFGGSSQINVGALIASSADFDGSTVADRNTQFLTNGIYSPLNGPTYTPSFTDAGAAITVDAGAQINANGPTSVTSGGGFVLLMGTTVQNAGSISTPDGQTELAAGDNFLIRPGQSTSGNQTSTTIGNEIAVVLNTPGSSLTGGSGLVTNTGMIEATTGDITLVGETVQQSGVAVSSTSVNTRGTIHLLTSASDPDASVTLAPDSLTAVIPDMDGATELDSEFGGLLTESTTENDARAAAFNAQFDDLSLLADNEAQSRVEIVSGNTVEFAGNSTVLANGGQVAVSAVNRVQVDTGADIDVSGIVATLPMSANELSINVQGEELADDPNNRESDDLNNANVFVDINGLVEVPAGTGGDSQARDFTPGGLLEVSGDLQDVEYPIGEWLSTGGSVTFSTGTASASGGSVVAQPGSIFNISGGAIQYQAGDLQQSYVETADGEIFNINTAPAGLDYTSIYDGFVDDSPAWGVSETFNDSLHTPSEVFEQGYIVGRNAGSLTLSTPTTVFEGTIDAGTIDGTNQTAAQPSGITDPALLPQDAVPQAGSLIIGDYIALGLATPFDTDVVFADDITPAAGSISVSDSIPTALNDTAWFDSDQINADGLGGLSITTGGDIQVDAPLDLAPGGQVSFFAPVTDIASSLTVNGGSVTIGDAVSFFPAGQTTATPQLLTTADGSTSVTVEGNIDTSGLFTNASLDPTDPTDEAFANGGDVSISSAQGITLAASSLIDASSGGAVLTAGKTEGGTGGNITLAADTDTEFSEISGTSPLTLDGTLQSMGVTAGGQLTLTALAVAIGDDVTGAAQGALVLPTSFFTQGFSSYDITGINGVSVAPGAQVNVTEPVYQFTAASFTAPTGSDPATVLQAALLPLFTANPETDTLTQRAGASLTLNEIECATCNEATGGPLTVGAGALLSVDPGQSITLNGFGQITVDGTLRAPGGTNGDGGIDIVNDTVLNASSTVIDPNGMSIWIGGDAVLDVAGVAATATDTEGRSFGVVTNGGEITLGSTQTGFDAGSGESPSTDAFIIIRPGALLDASGTSAVILPDSGAHASSGLATGGNENTPIDVASNGGGITMSSYVGIYDDGTLEAAAGGAGAAGGTLSVTLVDPIVSADVGPDADRVPRVIEISQDITNPLLSTTLQPGQIDPSLAIGQAQFSADAIEAGEFANLSFMADDTIEFNGNVDLTAGQSISFFQGALSDTSTAGQVNVAAPYVMLNGSTGELVQPGQFSANIMIAGGLTNQVSTGTLTISADLIDLQNTVRFGLSGTEVLLNGPTKTYDYAGFGNVDFISQGDIRFLPDQTPLSVIPTPTPTNVENTGDLSFTAAQLYPVTGAEVLVVAGLTPGATVSHNVTLAPNGVIDISGIGDAAPASPDIVGGSIGFFAATINQGGVVRAPLGEITLGQSSVSNLGSDISGLTTTVNLLPGSITSVSAAGLDIPYGGTADGVTYTQNGATITGFTPGSISIIGQSVTVAPGALLDLSGGGTLEGAGFIAGSGGNVDVLTTPLVKSNPSNTFSSASDQVYAIVPGYSGYAPLVSGEGTEPGVGQQITIPAGVPGLAAGTYTLLPADYALLPGAYRVELGKTGAVADHGVMEAGDGSFLLDGYEGVANTAIENAEATQIVLTPAATVLTYSSYNQTSLSDFLTSAAQSLDQFAPPLPSYGGSLAITLISGGSGNSFSFQGTALFDAATGGIAGSASITAVAAGGGGGSDSNLEIFAATPTENFPGVSVNAADLDAIDAPSLEIGGNDQENVENLTVDSGVVLSAPQILLVADNDITLQSGAEIDTLGQGAAPIMDNGFFSGFGSATLLAVSNNNLSFIGALGFGVVASPGTITLDAGSSIFSEGSIGFVTAGAVTIDPTAQFGTANLVLGSSAINIGTEDGAVVPTGLLLTQQLLDALFAGDVAGSGAPALQSLTLTAANSINIFGSTDLSVVDAATGQASVELVFNTPAIYGYGSATDNATLTVGTLVWDGIALLTSDTNGSLPTYASSPPGAVVFGGPGTGSGMLTINADEVIFGNGPNETPNDQATLDRLMLGFSTVNIDASSEITDSAKGTLAVYEVGNPTGSGAGTGGDLNLTTPLLTGGAGSVMGFTVGDTLNVSLPAGVTPGMPEPQDLGAEIDLAADTISVDSPVVLPSGRLTMTATGDVTLGANADLDLAGEGVPLFDQTSYAAGGTVSLESNDGNITQAAGGIIDVSAIDNNAGSITVEAIGAGAGQVALDGTLLGAATLSSGAVGSFTGGSITIEAQTLGDGAAGLNDDFAALNTSLNAGGFFLSRSFDFKQGDLTIGNGVQAQIVSVSVDGGSLTVDGLIDASGAAPGSISLAAQNALTLTAGAVLDAQGTVLQVDGTGAVIDAENKATVNLTAAQGLLTLTPGATIDVSSPEGLAPYNNPQGDVELNVERTTETGGDAEISAAAPLNIIGAGTIAVNVFWTYMPTDANGTIVQDNGTDTPVATTGADEGFVGLNQINTNSQLFIDAALATGSPLLGQLAGLIAPAYIDEFHLRPGVDIESATPDGNLTVAGDLDLAGFRYASLNPDFQQLASVYGSGEPMDLVVRAGGNLTIGGSISDGFASAPATPDDNGWVILAGKATPADIVADTTVALAKGTTFTPQTGSLGYSITITATSIDADTVFPLNITVSGKLTLTATIATTAVIVTTTAITEPDGTVIPAGTIPAGTVLPSGTALPAGTVLDAGTVLPDSVAIGATTIPAGTSLAAFSSITLRTAASLSIGDIIPAGTVVPTTVATRATVDGAQGSLYAVAPLLAAGDLSASISLVSGADLSAANTTAVQAGNVLAASGAGGNLTLADTHYNETDITVDPSVIRTGTGNFTIAAGGSFDEATLYGIYTAGTQSPMVGAMVANPLAGIPNAATGGVQPATVNEFELPLGLNDDGSKTVLGTANAAYEPALKDYQAYYPEDGGNLTVSVQGNLTGDFVGAQSVTSPTGSNEDSAAIGNWLFRQGGSIAGQATAWWINFGTFASKTGGAAHVSAFTGFGTLGGGNVTITVGGNAGDSLSDPEGAISATVASTGRVLADGTLVQTGGGTLIVNVGGVLNSDTDGREITTLGEGSDGIFTDLRGDTTITADAIGDIGLSFGSNDDDDDPRSFGPLTATGGTSIGGIVLAPGDGTVNVSTLGDLVIAGVEDAGRVDSVQNLTPFTTTAGSVTTDHNGGGVSSFTLWTDSTAIDLTSAGGNVTPNEGFEDGSGDVQDFFPPTLNVTADSGDIVLDDSVDNLDPPLELAPAPLGQLTLLAGGSIFGDGAIVDISGADPSIEATPFNPLFTSSVAFGSVTNASPDSLGSLLPFGPDTPTSDLHEGDPDPALIYAVNGDITDFTFGQVIYFFQPKSTGGGIAISVPATSIWYIGAKAAQIEAGGDIVASGNPDNIDITTDLPTTGEDTAYSNDTGFTALSVGNFIMNANPNDVSVVSAGQDIIYSSFQVGGPGLLEVSAGRNYYAGDQGTLVSDGPVFGVNQSNNDSGAGISLLAGVGALGPDYTAFANLYFNPANQADLGVPLDDQPGTVIETYSDQLLAWLQSRFGYTGTQANALNYFLSLPTAQQSIFVLQVYFDELNESGLDFNTSSAVDFKSYARGQQAIATLFPTETASGQSITYNGGITMFSGDVSEDANGHIEATTSGKSTLQSDSGIHTDFGGAIQTLAPGGETLVGVEGGIVPGAAAGVLTEGSGDIDMYSLDSILLGQSRILTTFGGAIVAWSAQGDINGGEGAKTTVIPTPPELTYDKYGNITIAPNVPSTGAGIGTLSPVPSVPPGNINLVTPLGTVNAGEAGIRVSGNLNIAALHIVNAANIQVKGTTTGIPTAPAPNVGALTTAGNAAGAAASAAAEAGKHNSIAAQPPIFILEILGYGGGGTTNNQQQQNKRKKLDTQASYDPAQISYNQNSAFQVLGAGQLTSEQEQGLTKSERRRLAGP